VAAGSVCLEQVCGSIQWSVCWFGRCLGRLIELRLIGVCQTRLASVRGPIESRAPVPRA
jgi:hypothetical protein